MMMMVVVLVKIMEMIIDGDDGYKDNCVVGDAHAQGASGMASSPCKICRSFIFARSKHSKFNRERHEQSQARDDLRGHT